MQRELRRANHLMAVGNHLNAAEIFMDIAARALDIGIVYPAPMLLMQAAHALLLGDAYEKSIEQATKGLELLAAQERANALHFEGVRYVEALEAAGRQKDAEDFRRWLQDRVPLNETEQKAAMQLPEKCPYCGASMSLEEVNTRSGQAAECQYCGSVVLPRNIE
ncbi:MAG TPA: hypothetical protein VH744_02365 [Terriglobales bacterium]